MKRLSASASLVSLLLAAVASAAQPDPAPQRTRISGHKLDMKTVGKETFTVLDGLPDKQVTVIGTNLKITCDHLEFIASEIGEKDAAVPNLDKFKYLLATGRVRIVQGDREATCGRAEVFPREDKMILTEKPVVDDHGSGWHGEGRVITMWRGERRVQILETDFEGPAIKDLGFDKDQPPPKAPAASPAPPAPPAVTVPGLPPPAKK